MPFLPPSVSPALQKRNGKPRGLPPRARKILVEARGLEPLASALRTPRSAKLSYAPTRKINIRVADVIRQVAPPPGGALIRRAIRFTAPGDAGHIRGGPPGAAGRLARDRNAPPPTPRGPPARGLAVEFPR